MSLPEARGPGAVEARRALRSARSPSSALAAAALVWLALVGSAALGDDPEGSAALPATVDLRPQLLEWGLTPRAQGRRPTCSVFTVVEAMEAALARASGKGERLSVEFANWAANEATRRVDDGSFFQDVWDGYAARGICPERLWPYGGRFRADARPSEDALAAASETKRAFLFRLHWIARLPAKPGITRAQLDEARRVLASGAPVCAGSYHSVLFVGYQDDPREAGGGVLLVRDSGAGNDAVRITYEAALARRDVLWIDVAPEF